MCDDDCDVDDGWRLETSDGAAVDGGDEDWETLAGERWWLTSLLRVDGGDGGLRQGLIVTCRLNINKVTV